MTQHHTIEIFSANCPLCRTVLNAIEVGKCAGCTMTVYDVNNPNEEIKKKMRNYGVNAVPTTIIDGKIRVVGIPNFPWICGEDLYKKLRKEYPLKRD